eukprot:7386744-Prymnesium_polylepis.3
MEDGARALQKRLRCACHLVGGGHFSCPFKRAHRLRLDRSSPGGPGQRVSLSVAPCLSASLHSAECSLYWVGRLTLDRVFARTCSVACGNDGGGLCGRRTSHSQQLSRPPRGRSCVVEPRDVASRSSQHAG